MKLSDIKQILTQVPYVHFKLENGERVPEHFHVTEIGIVSKHFIDCGGKVRTEKKANLQLWHANDFDHRLTPEKTLKIIALSEKALDMDDLEIEVEYQSNTVGKYGLEFDGTDFVLTSTHTNCLAQDHCGIAPEQLITTETAGNCCTPGGGCC